MSIGKTGQINMIAGVDIGNSTTEVCIGEVLPDKHIRFLSSASVRTTGTKGTVDNVFGIRNALKKAVKPLGKEINDIDLVRLNEAAPVIGDTAMETLTETIITDSTMIGHNPSTPAGAGQAVGELLLFERLDRGKEGVPYIVAVPESCGYDVIADRINRASERLTIVGLILQADEAVLVENRLKNKLPIIDEVRRIEKLPDGVPAAIEVALPGQSITMLSNPYGIATLLKLNAEETRTITPIAKSLIGKRSAVVIKTPGGNVKENVLPAGEIYFYPEEDKSPESEYKDYFSTPGGSPGKAAAVSVNLDEGAENIMKALKKAGNIRDTGGQAGTNVGNMLLKIKREMWDTYGYEKTDVRITDILAVDTLAPVLISGALAGETCLEKAVGIAAMVRTQRLPMQDIADRLEKEDGLLVRVAGVEAVMASIGAMTTPGTKLPLAMLDMGGGSTDAALVDENGHITLTHQAGAGELVSMLIQTELGLKERQSAEQIKRYPLAKVESLFHMRMESGQIMFLEESIDPHFLGSVILLTEGGFVRIEEELPMEKIVQVRKEAKRKVFLTNALRALEKVAPGGELRNISNVVLVGGSAKDFEIPEMLTEEFAAYRIVCGRGNIRGTEGPRNAVATGLVMSYVGEL